MQTHSSFEEHVAGNPKGKTDYNFDARCKSYSISIFWKKHNQCYQACRDLNFFNTWAPWDMLPLWQDNTTPVISNDNTQTRSPEFSNVMLTCYTLDRYKQKASNTVTFFFWKFMYKFSINEFNFGPLFTYSYLKHRHYLMHEYSFSSGARVIEEDGMKIPCVDS
jgi:hypothetical protein